MRINELAGEIATERETISALPFGFKNVPISVLMRCDQYYLNHNFRCLTDEYARLKNSLESKILTREMLTRVLSKRSFNQVRAESGEEKDGSISPNVVEIYGNITDVGGDTNDESKFGVSAKTVTLKDTNLALSQFFERPIQLLAMNIPNETDFDVNIEIWKQYFLNPTVRAKLRNYGFIRADMNIRIAVSGTPFHSGRLMATYLPCHLSNSSYEFYEANSTLRSNYLKYMSTIRGTSLINVKDNIPLEIKVPFISVNPMLRLFNLATTAISDTTPFDDTENMGVLLLKTLNNVHSIAEGTSTNTSVYVYAWLSNVQLGCSTGTFVQITTESGDERKRGPIESIASRAQEVLNAVSTIPMIAPYSKPSAMIMGGLSRIAALFGWSMPVLQTVPSRMKNEPFQNACAVIGTDTGHRLTYDPLQELTVDPRVCGSTQDELSLGFLNSRESLLSTFTWSPDNTPLVTNIYTCFVCPTASERLDADDNTHIQPTSMHFASMPFKYWRGTIKYRFDIVKSQFHRGKFAVIYEPNLSQSVLINSNLDLNKQFLKIIDIQETDSFEICIDWAFPRAWAKLASLQVGALLINYDDVTPNVFADFCNGYFTVVPINTLQSPDDSSVEINVFASSDDMLYNRVTNENIIDISVESGDDMLTNKPVSCYVLNPTGASIQNVSKDHFGETPTTFRTLLKRFFTTRTGQFNVDLTGPFSVTCPIIPNLYSGSNPLDYNHMFNLLRRAFIGMRGSLRKRVRFIPRSNETQYMSNFKVSLLPDSVINFFGTHSGAYNTDGRSSMEGVTTFAPHTNAGVEVEIPMYTNNLFIFCDDSYDDPKFELSFLRNYKIEMDFNTTSVSNIYVDYWEETATGEDFTFMGYLAPPPVYY